MFHWNSPGSSRLYRLGVPHTQKNQGLGRWAAAATRFTAYAPNFPFPWSPLYGSLAIRALIGCHNYMMYYIVTPLSTSCLPQEMATWILPSCFRTANDLESPCINLKRFENVEWHCLWMTFEDLERLWKIFDDLETLWMTLKVFCCSRQWPWRSFKGFGSLWMILNVFEWHWKFPFLRCLRFAPVLPNNSFRPA